MSLERSWKPCTRWIMRKTKKIVTKQDQLLDILCDGCGKSCRGELDRDHFEMARLLARFNEGDAAGDRFSLEICKDCFFDLMEWFLLDKKGVVSYHNVVDQEQSANLDELRLYFAHRRSGTLPEEYAECQDQ